MRQIGTTYPKSSNSLPLNHWRSLFVTEGSIPTLIVPPKFIHQRPSTIGTWCARAMVNNFAPRQTCPVIKLVFGTAGPTVTPSKDDEYSDLVGLTTQARLSLCGRRLGLKRILQMPMCNVSSIRTSPVPSPRGCFLQPKGVYEPLQPADQT